MPTTEMYVQVQGVGCLALRHIDVGRSRDTLRHWCEAGAVTAKKVRGVWFASPDDCELVALMSAKDRDEANLFLRSERCRAYRQRYMARRQEETLPTANHRGLPWDDWDDMVFEVEATDVERARLAERTFYGEQARKQKLRKEGAIG